MTLTHTPTLLTTNTIDSWTYVHMLTHVHTHTRTPLLFTHIPNSMWHGGEDQCVNTTKPGWWPPHGMTRWEILSAWPLIPAVVTDPPGRGETTEMDRQEKGLKKSDGEKYREGE